MISNNKFHSAFVTLELQIGERRIPLAQAAHNFAIATKPVEFPAGHGVVVMSIDGKIEHVSVFLPNGCRLGDRKFALEKPGDGSP